MGDRTKPHANEDREETIAAFDRERDEAHELHRRHRELIMNSRRNDRPAASRDDEFQR